MRTTPAHSPVLIFPKAIAGQELAVHVKRDRAGTKLSFMLSIRGRLYSDGLTLPRGAGGKKEVREAIRTRLFPLAAQLYEAVTNAQEEIPDHQSNHEGSAGN